MTDETGEYSVYQPIALNEKGHESFASEPLVIKPAGSELIFESEKYSSPATFPCKGFSGNGTVMFEADELKIGITGIKNFKVEQNTPNPFNPTTNISYELFDASYVKLKVFDLIGKEIATLVDANQQKGTYTVTFDASKYANLTSGIYFYKLETEKYSEVKKMILTK